MSDWADQVENEEARNGALANKSDFPSLGDAVKMQPKSKGKSKGVKLQLGEFLATQSGSKGEFTDKSLQDKQILASLPTAPRGGPREEGEGRQGGLGGGFRDYGGDREGRGSRFQRDDRPPREEREPSRADTVDDWGSTRKFVPGGDGGGFGGSRGFGGGFADRGDRGDRGDRPPREPRAPSAADMVDDWGSVRKFEPSGPSGPRGGFEDRERRGPERRFDGPPPVSKADIEDSWGRGREFKPAEQAPAPSRGFSGSRADAPVRENTAADREERWGRRAAEPTATSSSTQDAAPVERPRLKLAPRSVPAGEQASSSSAGGNAEERKPAANPFGAARPREEVLKEKGVDPIKEALKLEHGEVIRDETPAEKELKAQVEALQKQLADLKASAPSSETPAEGDEEAAKPQQQEQQQQVAELEAQLDAKERELLKLQVEEDDRVRFARGGGKDKER
ncbi:hypothetical protein Agub_g15058, partial [Astrephomene gubernaculifera]